MPTDPDAKAFVPDLPAVLQSTKLVREGETERLGFTAPSAPGEYIFVCTFPGHWVRMYGVMLVVESLEAFEAKPTVPMDPMTKQPFDSKHALTAAAAAHLLSCTRPCTDFFRAP